MNDGKFHNGFRKLIAWQRSHELTLAIYQITKLFPSDERYGITSQLRRASSSIGAQIAERSRMPTQVHRKIYYDRAYTLAAEVDNFLEVAKDLQYLSTQIYEELLQKINRLSYLVNRLSCSCRVKEN